MNYKIDELAEQVGGSLRLTSVIISRARQIIKNAPLHVETDIDDPVQIAFIELTQGKLKPSEGNSQPHQIPETKKMEKPSESDEKS